ncbi:MULTISPECIES: glycosyltransferase family 1 protein [unclassified Clostridium]|uniref:glycosyltransferase family 4 protein n=1 Tax=unclassified Clostridium TaxID=2614128 RepID=UPI000297C40B|nr:MULTISPECIES: glycosyltransferase family 1 protein [unclassified Clostridium]EKQ50523.1 MAG: glycosyltransferase [Clostridium sp. Maddingley MBC34-26]
MKVSLELHPCLKNRSGIGIYTYEISKNLQKFKDITLCGDIFNFINRNNIDIDLEELDFEINIFALFPYGVYRRVWHYIPIKHNWLFNDKADIYHFFNFIVPPSIDGKVITTVYDMTYELYPETMDKRNLKRLKTDMQYSVERSDKIITISESSKKDIMKFLNIDESKIEVVYCGVDYDRFNKSYSEEEKLKIREKYNLPKDYILYMGTLEPRKNIESIIEAFEIFKREDGLANEKVKLVIAGKKGWLFESIFNLVDKLNLKDEVIFTDYVDENDKPLIYNMASLFLFPSLYEGFGIPVLEAMASSVPVITSNVSSLPEVAGDAAILVAPKDIKSIAKYMNEILINEELKKDLVKKGHEQAKKFTWEASAQKVYNIYKEII